MAFLATVEDNSGFARELYIRLNNFDALSNHGAPAEARFRGFTSADAYRAGAAFTWEWVISFAPDLSEAGSPIWKQAYDALRTYDFTVFAQSATGLLMAASLLKDGEIERLEQSFKANERIATEQGRQDDPRVASSLADLRVALASLREEKRRLENEIATGRAEVAKLEDLSKAFAEAKTA